MAKNVHSVARQIRIEFKASLQWFRIALQEWYRRRFSPTKDIYPPVLSVYTTYFAARSISFFFNFLMVIQDGHDEGQQPLQQRLALFNHD
jgi:hypothetical protein